MRLTAKFQLFLCSVALGSTGCTLETVHYPRRDGSVGVDAGSDAATAADSGWAVDGGDGGGASPCRGAGDCAAPDHATATCTDGGCGFECDSRFADCNALADDGCEADLTSSAEHCGACGASCGSPMRCLERACRDPVVQVSAGFDHTCARTAAGSVRCWGGNSDGQLGDGTATSRSSPADVTGLGDASDVAAGGTHTCAVRRTGEVLCWGDNRGGQIGTGAPSSSFTIPTAATDIADAVQVASGQQNTCVIRSDDTVWCWGENGNYALGTTMATYGPVRVDVSGAFAASVAVGSFHVCARTLSGMVQCWGQNSFGQLGGGHTLPIDYAIIVSRLPDASAVAAGAQHSCALRATGVLVCWGGNSAGQLGDTTTTDRLDPTPADLSDVRQVCTGVMHTCAVTSADVLYCWGRNADGQIGNATVDSRATPTRVADLAAVEQVTCGARHTCALLRDGSVWCWGDNSLGQLGDGTVMTSTLPRRVVGIP